MDSSKQISAQSHRIPAGLEKIDSFIRNELEVIPEIDLNFLQLEAEEEIVKETDHCDLIQKQIQQGRLDMGVLDIKQLISWFLESKIVSPNRFYPKEEVDFCLEILKHEKVALLVQNFFFLLHVIKLQPKSTEQENMILYIRK